MSLPTEEHKSCIAQDLFSCGLALLCVVFVCGALDLWQAHGVRLWGSSAKGAALACLLLLCAACLAKPKSALLSLSVRSYAATWALLFASDWLCRGYNFLQGPSIRGEIILCSVLSAVCLARKVKTVFIYWLPASCAALAASFFLQADGRILFSDDNATFFYRFTLLKDYFPHLPFYSPLWNGGIEARDFFATGSLNVFAFFYPLFHYFRVEQIYNVVVCVMLFGLTPACVYLSARLEKLPHFGAALAGILALGGSLLWYRWALKYGTLGFIFTALLVPLNLSLAVRVVARDVVIEPWQALLFIVSFSLMLLWSPSGLIFVPIIVLAGTRLGGILRKRFALLIALSILLINLPWIAALWEVSQVAAFVSAAPAAPSVEQSGTSADLSTQRSHPAGFKSRAKELSFERVLDQIREVAVSTHPLLWLFLLPGIFLLPKRSRIPLGASYLWLLALGSLVPSLKPQMEFDRMLIVLGLCASVPCAAVLTRLIDQSFERKSVFSTALTAVSLGAVLAAPLSAVLIVRNRSIEQYALAGPDVEQMAKIITEHGGDGRILFSGFVLHELSGGHLAPLTYMTGRPLMASSHVHNLWRYRQIVPAEFMARDDQGIEEYFDLYNVSEVFAHERFWREYFSAHPERYELLWKGETFRLFRRINSKHSYFVEGDGQILAQQPNGVELKLRTPEAVVKFNYLPFLQAPGCELSEEKISASVSFIRLSACVPDQVVKISALPISKRLLHAWGL